MDYEHCKRIVHEQKPEGKDIVLKSIPKGTTSKIQPLDVYGFRVWKNYVRCFSDDAQAEIVTLCRLCRSVKCCSDLGDRLLITNVGTMLGNNWPNLIPTVEEVIYRQWMYKVYPVSIQPR